MTHVRKEPRLWNELEGDIIRSIVILGLKNYSDIIKLSSIPEDIFNSLLNGMLYDGDLQVSENDEYTVELNLYNDYKEYFRTHEDKEIIDVIGHDISDNKIDHYNDVKDWIKLHSPNTSLDKKHFYLDGYLLNDFLRYSISKAKKEVIMVNPYVELVDITQLLVELMHKKKSVVLITRSPDNANKKECHDLLTNNGVKIMYVDSIHAKIILIDDRISIVSSINFTKNPMSGFTWEAGMVSIDSKTLTSIRTSIKNFLSVHIMKK